MSMYRNWSFLKLLALTLDAEAAQLGIDLPNVGFTTLAELLAEAGRFGLAPPDPNHPQTRQIKNLKSRLAVLRADKVEQMRLSNPAFKQLAERLNLDGDPYDLRTRKTGHPLAGVYNEVFRLRQAFEGNSFHRAASRTEKECIRVRVVEKLYFVVIRNATYWYVRGNKDTAWWGYVYCSLPSLIKKAALECAAPAGMLTNQLN